MRTIALATLVLLPAFIAACSGGGSETSKTGETAQSDAEASSNDGTTATTASTQDVTLASLTGNVAAGKAAFAQCSTCHVTDAGVNKIGPSLHGVVGRKAGTVKGFNYSPANAAIGITWTKENLFQFLVRPQSVVPKTKMIFAGIPDAQKRADIIAYLENPT